MAVFLDTSGRFYSADLPKSLGDAIKPFVSDKLKRVLDAKNGASMSEEEINDALAALDQIQVVTDVDQLSLSIS